MKKKSFKPIAAILILVILIAGIIALRVINADSGIDTQPLPTVSVAHAEKGDIAVETSLIGTIEPGDVYYVIPKATGEITEIFVSSGDYVYAGDPIARIDNSKSVDAARITLDAANVSLTTARDAVELARTNLERMQVLLGTGDISQASYESYESAYDQAVAAVEGYELQLESAQLNYDTQVEYALVTAPADGTVETTSMTLNAMATSSSYLCIITADQGNKLTFSITDRLLGLLSVGDPIRVTRQGTDYTGRITSIENMISATTGLYPVEAEFEGSDSLPMGARVKVYFDGEKATDVLTVDTDWIYYDGGKSYIYTLTYDSDNAVQEGSSISEANKAGTIHKNLVETGISTNERTEIVSGIGEEDLVVKTWTSQLYEGAKVQVLPEE